MSWYAVIPAPGMAKRVAAAFEDHGIRVFQPMERLWRNTGHRTAFDRPVFSSYVFVSDETVPVATINLLVHDIYGAVRLFQVDGKPGVVPDWWVNDIRSMWETGDFDYTLPRDRKTGKVKRALEIGDEVVCLERLYFGYKGTLLRLTGRRKAEVMISWFQGQMVKTTVDLAKLEAA